MTASSSPNVQLVMMMVSQFGTFVVVVEQQYQTESQVGSSILNFFPPVDVFKIRRYRNIFTAACETLLLTVTIFHFDVRLQQSSCEHLQNI